MKILQFSFFFIIYPYFHCFFVNKFKSSLKFSREQVSAMFKLCMIIIIFAPKNTAPDNAQKQTNIFQQLLAGEAVGGRKVLK